MAGISGEKLKSKDFHPLFKPKPPNVISKEC
jgi:hypothetical protein